MNIGLTKQAAIENGIDVRYHKEVTGLSFIICDPSPKKEGDVVDFSQKAYVVCQVLDRNLDIDDWSLYRKTKAKDRYAFNGYVKWFKDVWESRSEELPLIDLPHGKQVFRREG